jgi:hypothetical protein
VQLAMQQSGKVQKMIWQGEKYDEFRDAIENIRVKIGM